MREELFSKRLKSEQQSGHLNLLVIFTHSIEIFSLKIPDHHLVPEAKKLTPIHFLNVSMF